MMEFKREVKPKTINLVLDSIKRGNYYPKEMLKDINISQSSLHNALRKLCFHGVISKDFGSRHNKYKLECEE